MTKEEAKDLGLNNWKIICGDSEEENLDYFIGCLEDQIGSAMKRIIDKRRTNEHQYYTARDCFEYADTFVEDAKVLLDIVFKQSIREQKYNRYGLKSRLESAIERLGYARELEKLLEETEALLEEKEEIIGEMKEKYEEEYEYED